MFKRGQGKFLADIILLLIAENPAYGYEIADRLIEFGIDFPPELGQKGRIYRILSFYEQNNLIEFKWDTTTSPPRKTYNITSEGKDYLRAAMQHAEGRIALFSRFISHVEKVL